MKNAKIVTAVTFLFLTGFIYNNFFTKSMIVVVDSVNIICSSNYELMRFNTKSKVVKRILESTGSHFKIIRYNEKLGKIFFQKRDDSNNIYSIDINGSNLKKISINVD